MEPARCGRDAVVRADWPQAAMRHPGVERALAAMRAQFADPLPLHTLAEIAGLSQFHFARLFRRLTGVPPNTFLAALRLQEAKRLLLTTDLPVIDICFSVGYQSLGTFTARFTHLVGVTPTQLRHLPAAIAAVDLRSVDATLPTARAPLPSQITGRIDTPDASGMIAVGLFRSPVPQGRPAAGTHLAAPGPFQFRVPVDGRYHLLAAALPATTDTLTLLLPGDKLRVGAGSEPLQVRGGRAFGSTTLTLRPLRPTDPPLLLSLPALMLKTLAAQHARP
jgi:AraC-like DNA-binding protein